LFFIMSFLAVFFFSPRRVIPSVYFSTSLLGLFSSVEWLDNRDRLFPYAANLFPLSLCSLPFVIDPPSLYGKKSKKFFPPTSGQTFLDLFLFLLYLFLLSFPFDPSLTPPQTSLSNPVSYVGLYNSLFFSSPSPPIPPVTAFFSLLLSHL